MTNEYRNLLLRIDGKVAHVTLNRPELHNAFNAELIGELTDVFTGIGSDDSGAIRAVVLSGNGKSFCAGADVTWMRESLEYTREQNVADALRMSDMFAAIDRCPVPVIGKVHGAALGGGIGLAAVCDIVIVAQGAVWAFSEARLGIAPAVISPYVLSKIGCSHARALFFTAERFPAERAVQIGLAHLLVPPDELDAQIERLLKSILSCSPKAIARAKELIAAVPDLSPQDARQLTAETIASLRVSPEGQEGLSAFLEKRTAEWAG